jgi:hypothetical protein
LIRRPPAGWSAGPAVGRGGWCGRRLNPREGRDGRGEEEENGWVGPSGSGLGGGGRGVRFRLIITDLMDGPNHLERISNGCSHMRMWMSSPHAATTKLKACSTFLLHHCWKMNSSSLSMVYENNEAIKQWNTLSDLPRHDKLRKNIPRQTVEQLCYPHSLKLFLKHGFPLTELLDNIVGNQNLRPFRRRARPKS